MKEKEGGGGNNRKKQNGKPLSLCELEQGQDRAVGVHQNCCLCIVFPRDEVVRSRVGLAGTC